MIIIDDIKSHLSQSAAPTNSSIPLSLYVHIPWCVRKCPYCDFNSHEAGKDIPVEAYLNALIRDLEQDKDFAQGRQISSIFFGGGTPSLFPAAAIGKIISAAHKVIGLSAGAEITLEANPGTAEYDKFQNYRAAGVNRLSMGAQSFNDQHLKNLGRIHSGEEISSAFNLARKAGFDNINLDLIHGLQDQTPEQSESDILTAIDLGATHISWYQLTIEPNTAFYSAPPALPEESILCDIIDGGQALLSQHGFTQYEISAYSQQGQQSQHNLNYWTFGDYLAIGAGAHGKITQLDNRSIFRFNKTRLPKDYIDKNQATKNAAFIAKRQNLSTKELPLEFLMNTLRLTQGFDLKLFEQRTFLDAKQLTTGLNKAKSMGLIDMINNTIKPTSRGQAYLNNLLEMFL